MGLFDKKNCDICGEKIGLLGSRKVDDGTMCSKCTKQLSPFTTDRRKTTLAEIREHLAYREANKAEVAAFKATRVLGGGTKVIIDEGAGKFIVTSANNWQNDNPDVIGMGQIISCNTGVRETRTEIMRQNKDGKMVSHIPRQYSIECDFYVTIHVNSPFFSEIEFKLNNVKVDETSRAYRDFTRQMEDIRQALTQPRTTSQATAQPQVEQVAAPAAGPINCLHCGAKAATSAGKFCEFCGGAMRE